MSTMHCNSKLSRIDEKIDFLERKLFEHCMIIDEFETSLKKLKVLSTSASIQFRKQSFFESKISPNKGKFSLMVLSCLYY